MIQKKILLWEKEEYQYPAGFGFIPFLMSYIHEDTQKDRACVIVVPGGGYRVVSPSESELVAKKFYEMGCNTFVCTYTTNLLGNAPLKKQPMRDLSRAIRYIRKNADLYKINPGKIIVCGFSAGAHLCGSVCVHWEDIPDEEYEKISNRPDAAILSYPVITTGDYAHRDSFLALLGTEAGQEELSYMSLEKQVTRNTPPCFIWQTATDELVPVENSFFFARSCKEAGVPFAYHVFSEGPHGMSLANADWAEKNYGVPYTMEQIHAIINYFHQSQIPLPEPLELLAKMTDAQKNDSDSQMEELENAYANMKESNEVKIWPELAERWLDSLKMI